MFARVHRRRRLFRMEVGRTRDHHSVNARRQKLLVTVQAVVDACIRKSELLFGDIDRVLKNVVHRHEAGPRVLLQDVSVVPRALTTTDEPHLER